MELLAESFADSIDAASLVGYIRTQIVKYLAEQERFFAKGQGVCLVGARPSTHTINSTPASCPACGLLLGSVAHLQWTKGAAHSIVL